MRQQENFTDKNITLYEELLSAIEELKNTREQISNIHSDYYNAYIDATDKKKLEKDTIEEKYKPSPIEEKITNFDEIMLDKLVKKYPSMGLPAIAVKMLLRGSMFSAATMGNLGALSLIPHIQVISPFLLPIFQGMYLLKHTQSVKNMMKEREMLEKGLIETRMGKIGETLVKTDMLLNRMNLMLTQLYALPGIIGSTLSLFGGNAARIGSILHPFTSIFSPVNFIGNLMLHTPLLGSILSGISSTLGLPFLTPQLLGYIGFQLLRVPISFLRQIFTVGEKRPNYLNAFQIEKEISSSEYLRPFVLRLMTDKELSEKIKPTEFLMLEVLMMIESHTAVIPLLYNLLQNKFEYESFESDENVQSKMDETIYESSSGKSWFEKLLNRMEEFMFITNPIMQLSEFVFRGITPVQWLKNRRLEEQRAEVLQEYSRVFGMGTDAVKAVYTTSQELVSGIQNPINKMVVLLQAIYDVNRLQLAELISIRYGLGIKESFKVALPEEQAGMGILDRLQTVLIDLPMKIGNMFQITAGGVLGELMKGESIPKALIKGIGAGTREGLESLIDLPIIYGYFKMIEPLLKVMPGIKEFVPYKSEYDDVSLRERIEQSLMVFLDKYELRKRKDEMERPDSIEGYLRATQIEIGEIFKQQQTIFTDEIKTYFIKELKYLAYLKKIYELLKVYGEKRIDNFGVMPLPPHPTLPGAPEAIFINKAPEPEDNYDEKIAVGEYIVNTIKHLNEIKKEVRKDVGAKILKFEKEEKVELPDTFKSAMLTTIPNVVAETVETTAKILKYNVQRFEKGGVVQATKDWSKNISDSIFARLSHGEVVIPKPVLDLVNNVISTVISKISEKKENIKDHIVTVKERLEKIKEERIEKTFNKMVSLLKGVNEKLDELKKDEKSLLGKLVNVSTAGFNTLKEKIKSLTEKITDGESKFSLKELLLSALGGLGSKAVSIKDFGKSIFSILMKSIVGRFAIGSIITGLMGIFTNSDAPDTLHRILGGLGMAILGGASMVAGFPLGLFLSLILVPLGKILGYELADALEKVYKFLTGKYSKDTKKKAEQEVKENFGEKLGRTLVEIIGDVIRFTIDIVFSIPKMIFDFIASLFEDNKEKTKEVKDKAKEQQETLVAKILKIVWDVVKFIVWDVPIAIIENVFGFIWGVISEIPRQIWKNIEFLTEKIWEDIKSFTHMIFEFLKFVYSIPIRIVKYIWHKIKSIFDSNDESRTDKLKKSLDKNIHESIVSKVINFLTYILTIPYRVIKSILDYIENMPVIGNVVKFIEKVVDKITDIVIYPFKWIYQKYRDMIGEVMEFIYNTFGKIPIIGKKIRQYIVENYKGGAAYFGLSETENILTDQKENIQNLFKEKKLSEKQKELIVNSLIQDIATLYTAALSNKKYSKLSDLDYNDIIEKVLTVELPRYNLENIRDPNKIKSLIRRAIIDAILQDQPNLLGYVLNLFKDNDTYKQIQQNILSYSTQIGKYLESEFGFENTNVQPEEVINPITTTITDNKKGKEAMDSLYSLNSIKETAESLVQKSNIEELKQTISEKIGSIVKSTEKHTKELSEKIVSGVKDATNTAALITKETINTVASIITDNKLDITFDNLVDKSLNSSVIDISNYTDNYYFH